MASREPKPSGAGSSEWTTSPPLSAASAPHTPCRHEPTNLAPHAVVPTTANNPLKAHCLMHTYGERSGSSQGQALDARFRGHDGKVRIASVKFAPLERLRLEPVDDLAASG